MPSASRRSSLSVWSCAKERKSWTAIAVVTRAATRMPQRKISGRRTRSDENTPPSSLEPRVHYRTLRVSVASGPRGVLLRVADRRDLVADTPDRDDRRGVAELAPQLTDVHVNGSRVAGEGVAPDPLEQLVARQDEPTVVEQFPEEIELLRCE